MTVFAGGEFTEQVLELDPLRLCQHGEHGFLTAVEEPVTAFSHQVSKRSWGEIGAAMTRVLSCVVTLVLSFVMAVGATGIGGGFAAEEGLALSAPEVISVAVVRAAGAFIHVFHNVSPCRDDVCGVCDGGVPRGTAAPSP